MDGSIALGLTGAPRDGLWLERLLAADAAAQPHLADDGFAARVLFRAYASQPRVSRWLVPLMTAAACGVTAFVTPAGEYLARGLTGLIDWHHLSASTLLMLVPIAVLYACSIEASRDV